LPGYVADTLSSRYAEVARRYAGVSVR
jgi:hypothetical protein